MELTAKPSDWVSVIALGVIWGGTFMFVRIALNDYGPLTVATARTTLGALTLWGALAIMGRTIPWGNFRLWRFVVPIGIASTSLPFFLLSWGQQHVPSAFAGLTMATAPLFVLPLAHWFSDEPMMYRKFVGVCLGFSGAVILIGPTAISLGTNSIDLFARVACVGAALSYAVSSVITRQCPPVEPLVLSAMALLVGSISILPIMFWVEGMPKLEGTVSTSVIIFLGLVPTAFATLLRVRIIRSAGSVFMSLVNYQVPIWSMIFGAWLLSEDLPFRFFAALALILAGLVISQLYSLQRIFTAPKP